jgi:hypothetical protein
LGIILHGSLSIANIVQILTDIYPFLLIVGIIFLVLLIIHLHWAAFVDFLNNIFLPILQIILNDFVRFIWNDLFITLWNILVQLWDSMVQIIGFFIYFALNMFVTVVQIVIQLIGVLDLPALFEDIMSIVVPIVQLATEILKLLITVGSAIIEKLIPILIAILKIWFEYIKILFEIISWLLVTLFRVLRPLLGLVIKVVQVVVSIFRVGNAFSSRVLLSLEKNSREARGTSAGAKASPKGFSGFYGSGASSGAFGGMDAGEWMVNELYTAATRDYTLQQYDKMFDSLSVIHSGIMAEDVFHSQAGYHAEPGETIPDYTRHIYTEEEAALGKPERKGGKLAEEDFEEWEKEEETIVEDEESGVLPRPVETKSPFDRRDLKSWSGIDVGKLSHDEAKNLEQTKLDFLEELMRGGDEGMGDERQQQRPGSTPRPSEPAGAEESLADFVSRFTSYQVKKTPRTAEPAARIADERSGRKPEKKNPLGAVDPYSVLHPDDHWRVDFSANMTSAEVFPGLKGKKLVRPDFSSIRKTHSPRQMHERRKRAVAYAHAIQTAYIKVHKKHIGNGHVHEVFSNGWKHLTGHDSVHGWFEKFESQYISPAHFIYSIVPSTHDKGFFKHLWRADPDFEKRPPFHAWIEREFRTENISRDYWVKLEEFSKAKEAGLAHDEANIESAYGPVSAAQGKRATSRALLMDFFGGLNINLEILYQDDCFTTPRRNILCLPFIPTNWVIPFINLSSVVLTRDLNDNPACEPIWKSTDCILCWEGVWNTIQEFRFSLYLLDLISIILIFGIRNSLFFFVYKKITDRASRHLHTASQRIHWISRQDLSASIAHCGPHSDLQTGGLSQRSSVGVLLYQLFVSTRAVLFFLTIGTDPILFLQLPLRGVHSAAVRLLRHRSALGVVTAQLPGLSVVDRGVPHEAHGATPIHGDV